MADLIRAAVAAEPLEWNGVILTVTITIGLAELCPAVDIDEAIRRGDEALYRGKDTGRNVVVSAR